MSEYDIHIPGLAAAIASSPASMGHAAVLRALRRLPELARLRLASSTQEAGGVASLAEAWGADSGTAKHTGLTRWPPPPEEEAPVAEGSSKLYLVTDHGGDPADFIQICLSVDPAASPDRSRQPAPHYRLVHAIDMGRLVALAQSLDGAGQTEARTAPRAGRAAGATGPRAAARPGLRPKAGGPCNATRIFSDWYNSSAGRSGARLCDHWIMRFSDWTDPHTSERRISLMPGWTSPQRLHAVRAERGNIHLLYRQLQLLDQRMGVPFSWFFHMLVGSRVQFDAGYHVLSAAEQGLLAMPDHDARVLRDWWALPYGY